MVSPTPITFRVTLTMSIFWLLKDIKAEYTRYRCGGKGYDVLMDVVERIEGKDNYKYEGEI